MFHRPEYKLYGSSIRLHYAHIQSIEGKQIVNRFNRKIVSRKQFRIKNTLKTTPHFAYYCYTANILNSQSAIEHALHVGCIERYVPITIEDTHCFCREFCFFVVALSIAKNHTFCHVTNWSHWKFVYALLHFYFVGGDSNQWFEMHCVFVIVSFLCCQSFQK